LIAHESINHVAAHEEVPPALVMASSDHSGHSATPPPAANSYTYVADKGGFLDQYLGRSEMANGLLTFVFTTTAPVVPTAADLNQDGSLTGIGLDRMYRSHKLSRRSYLQLHVWDVDHDAPDCAEVDVVYINGNRIEQSGSPATLRNGNGIWDTWGVFFPTSFLRFPLTPYASPNGFLPALNVVNIEVNTQQCEMNDWKVEVDWGAVSVRPSLNYGLFFVHGWTGNPGGFKYFDELAQQDGYLSFISQRLQEGVLPLGESAQFLMQEISDTAAYSDTDKVFVVAHSRGGLFARAALREFPNLASKIAGYITLSTPHHGADAADNVLSNGGLPFLNRCRSVSNAEACKVAARSLRKEEVRKFNYGEHCREEWKWWPPGYVWVDYT
jgi:pimeloyl-ACP methyl ester carboxylesterase